MRWVGCTGIVCTSVICGGADIGSALTAGHFSFGKSNQNHLLPVWPSFVGFLTSACTQVAFGGVWTGVDEDQKRIKKPDSDRSPRSAWECSPGRSASFDAERHAIRRTEILQTPQSATLEGRAQALRRGQRGMDAALAAPGHGWPMAACPRSNAGTREPDEGGPDIGAGPFWLLFRLLEKVTRRKGGTNVSHIRDNGYTHN